MCQGAERVLAVICKVYTTKCGQNHEDINRERVIKVYLHFVYTTEVLKNGAAGINIGYPVWSTLCIIKNTIAHAY